MNELWIEDNQPERCHQCGCDMDEDRPESERHQGYCECCVSNNQVECVGGCFEKYDADDLRTSKHGPMCTECYIEHLETEIKNRDMTLSYVFDFIKQEATVLEAAMADFASKPRDPETIGRMVGKTRSEVNTMKFYTERMAV